MVAGWVGPGRPGREGPRCESTGRGLRRTVDQVGDDPLQVSGPLERLVLTAGHRAGAGAGGPTGSATPPGRPRARSTAGCGGGARGRVGAGGASPASTRPVSPAAASDGATSSASAFSASEAGTRSQVTGWTR